MGDLRSSFYALKGSITLIWRFNKVLKSFQSKVPRNVHLSHLVGLRFHVLDAKCARFPPMPVSKSIQFAWGGNRRWNTICSSFLLGARFDCLVESIKFVFVNVGFSPNENVSIHPLNSLNAISNQKVTLSIGLLQWPYYQRNKIQIWQNQPNARTHQIHQLFLFSG